MTDLQSSSRLPSMRDVARLAGVSPQTVSRVSSGEDTVSPRTKSRVQKAMRELGYRPNAAARAMKRGEFRTVGIIYHSLIRVGTSRPVDSISRFAAQSGYSTMLLPIDTPTQTEADGAFSRLDEMAVDVIITIMPTPFEGPSESLLLTTTPKIVQGSTSLEGVASIDFDQRSGTFAAVKHLLDLGHETVHHISGPQYAPDGTLRRQAWKDCLRLHNREINSPSFGDWSPYSGYVATKELLSRENQPTAIFVANDQMALGAYRALRERGLRIPEDISVVGFDDLEESQVFFPPLTTVGQDWDLFGKTVIEMSLAMIQGGTPTHEIIPTSLTVRDSTAKLLV